MAITIADVIKVCYALSLDKQQLEQALREEDSRHAAAMDRHTRAQADEKAHHVEVNAQVEQSLRQKEQALRMLAESLTQTSFTPHPLRNAQTTREKSQATATQLDQAPTSKYQRPGLVPSSGKQRLYAPTSQDPAVPPVIATALAIGSPAVVLLKEGIFEIWCHVCGANTSSDGQECFAGLQGLAEHYQSSHNDPYGLGVSTETLLGMCGRYRLSEQELNSLKSGSAKIKKVLADTEAGLNRSQSSAKFRGDDTQRSLFISSRSQSTDEEHTSPSPDIRDQAPDEPASPVSPLSKRKASTAKISSNKKIAIQDRPAPQGPTLARLAKKASDTKAISNKDTPMQDTPTPQAPSVSSLPTKASNTKAKPNKDVPVQDHAAPPAPSSVATPPSMKARMTRRPANAMSGGDTSPSERVKKRSRGNPVNYAMPPVDCSDLALSGEAKSDK